MLEGDIGELPLLGVAARGREMLETVVDLCWIGDAPRAGRPLLGQLADAAGIRQLTESEFDDLLAREQVRAVVISQQAWRRHAGKVWGRTMSSAIYVCRTGMWGPPQRVVCGADTTTTADALLDRVKAAMDLRPREIAVVHAVPRPPLWAQTLCGLHGFGWAPLGITEEFRFRCRTPSSVVLDWDSPETALRKACNSWKPDLVVLGWHRHAFPLPDRWLHRTAWRLSTELPHDVLLVPLRGDNSATA